MTHQGLLLIKPIVWSSYLASEDVFHYYFLLLFVCSRSTLLVELENERVLNYAAGDHIGVFPENSPELVMGILKHIPDAPPTSQSVRLEYLSEAGPGKCSTKLAIVKIIIMKNHSM